MSELLSSLGGEGGRLTGLGKLMSARKKVEVLLSRSQKTNSAESSVLSPCISPSTEKQSASETEIARQYISECSVLHLTPHRTVTQICSRGAPILDFSRCHLGCNGAVPLFRALPSAVGLSSLSLRGCGLTDPSIVVLADSLTLLSTVIALDVSDNPEIRHSGGFALERLVANSKGLVSVGLEGTNIRESTARIITNICDKRAQGAS